MLCGFHGSGIRFSKRQLFDFYGLNGDAKVNLISQWQWPLSSPRLVHHVRSAASLFDPDLVYARLCLLPLVGLAPRRPLIFEMHTPGPVGESRFRRTLFERVIKRKGGSRLVVTTEVLRAYLLDRYPEQDVKLARLSAEHPIEINMKTLAEFKVRNQLDTPGFRVGYTGFLDSIGLRGIHVICALAEQLPDVCFDVVGGPEEQVRYWRKRCKALNIRFHGRQTPNTMPLYLRSFDVVLAPVQLKTLPSAPMGRNLSPLKIPQYFAYGCAIVGSDLPAHRELIQHGSNGLLVPADDISAWVVAIRRLQTEKGLKERIMRGAAAMYAREFTPKQRIDRILDGFV